MGNLFLALGTFWRVLTNSNFATKVKALSQPSAEEKKIEKENKPKEALELLTLLQEEGRLVDFLQEDISDFEDEQIGAAVRDIHGKCRKVLSEYFAITPVVKGEEGSQTTIAEGFNPTEIKLVGQVSGNPPFHGTIKHHGWKVTKAKFPPKTQNLLVLAPAEVEI